MWYPNCLARRLKKVMYYGLSCITCYVRGAEHAITMLSNTLIQSWASGKGIQSPGSSMEDELSVPSTYIA